MKAESLMEQAIQKVALEILEQSKARRYSTRTSLHQTNFIKNPSKLKALFCTKRRAAKSYTAGLGLFQTALDYSGM